MEQQKSEQFAGKNEVHMHITTSKDQATPVEIFAWLLYWVIGMLLVLWRNAVFSCLFFVGWRGTWVRFDSCGQRSGGLHDPPSQEAAGEENGGMEAAGRCRGSQGSSSNRRC